MRYAAIIDGELVEIELTKSGANLEAKIADEKYAIDAKLVEPGVYWFNWNNRSVEIAVIPAGDGYVVSINNQRFSAEIVDTRTKLRKAAQSAGAGSMELRAPMPGKVVKVLVGEGAEVEMNQGIIVVEAMKMQNEVKSPKKGTVKKLNVNPESAVNAGDLLATVE